MRLLSLIAACLALSACITTPPGTPPVWERLAAEETQRLQTLQGLVYRPALDPYPHTR